MRDGASPCVPTDQDLSRPQQVGPTRQTTCRLASGPSRPDPRSQRLLEGLVQRRLTNRISWDTNCSPYIYIPVL
jgi:hypothetical protein